MSEYDLSCLKMLLNKHKICLLFIYLFPEQLLSVKITALQNHRMAEAGRDHWRSPCPMPCSGRATQSRLPRTMSRSLPRSRMHRNIISGCFWINCGVKELLLKQYPNLCSGLSSVLPFIRPIGLTASQTPLICSNPHRVWSCSYSNFTTRGLKQEGGKRL